MAHLEIEPVASSDGAARVLSHLEEAAWVLAGFDHLVRSGALIGDALRILCPASQLSWLGWRAGSVYMCPGSSAGPSPA